MCVFFSISYPVLEKWRYVSAETKGICRKSERVFYKNFTDSKNDIVCWMTTILTQLYDWKPYFSQNDVKYALGVGSAT